MNNYFRLARSEEERYGVAYSPDDVSSDLVDEPTSCEDWKPIAFTLRDGGFSDYQPNDLGWPLCSAKLKATLEQNASAADSIVWLPVKILEARGLEAEYYILHISDRPDVLDKNRSILVDDFVVKPVFSRRLIGNHSVFAYPSGRGMVIVSDAVKDAVTSSNCAGVHFIKVPVSE